MPIEALPCGLQGLLVALGPDGAGIFTQKPHRSFSRLFLKCRPSACGEGSTARFTLVGRSARLCRNLRKRVRFAPRYTSVEVGLHPEYARLIVVHQTLRILLSRAPFRRPS
jgi:hypothetical protein